MALPPPPESAGMCVECEDTPCTLRCQECDDKFCLLCFQWQHKTGTRSKHTPLPLPNSGASLQGTTMQFTTNLNNEGGSSSSQTESTTEAGSESSTTGKKRKASEKKGGIEKLLRTCELDAASLSKRVRFIPLRLTEDERELLSIVEGALTVSEYVDKVDISHSDYGFGFGWRMFMGGGGGFGSDRGNKQQAIQSELEDIFNLINGLHLTCRYKEGIKLSKTSDEQKLEFYQRIFEVGRRYKITNPDKMRSNYGKMMFLLQDASEPGILPGWAKLPIQTVEALLEEHDCLSLVKEDAALVIVATRDISPTVMPDPEEMKVAGEEKAEALKKIMEKYKGKLPKEDLERVLNSISDNNSFIAANRSAVDTMIRYLTTYFKPNQEECSHSLEISYGRGGSKLSHTHRTQYTFVLQSLLLWREIMSDMFYLWFMAEEDLLSEENRYRLRSTGQGLNRVQAAPHVGRAMHSILSRVQSEVKSWVGLSVVHLGDQDVPNALVFIDKYTQVPRILCPISRVIDSLDQMAEDPGIKKMIDESFGGVEKLRLDILASYFRHGFDGSGSDGGSCIDGRLTSSWNWCSKLHKKRFYPIFMLSGFFGFDGDWKK